MQELKRFRIFALICVSLLSFHLASATEGDPPPPGSSPMRVDNLSGFKLHFYWINFRDGKLMRQGSALRNSSSTVINSYPGHSFLFTTTDAESGTKASDVDGMKVKHTHGGKKEIVYVRSDDGDDLYIDAIDPTEEVKRDLASVVNAACDHLLQGSSTDTDTYEMEVDADGNLPLSVEGSGSSAVDLDAYKDCLMKTAAAETLKLKQKLITERTLRDKMADGLRNYTCADPTARTTPEKPINQLRWMWYDTRYHDPVLQQKIKAKGKGWGKGEVAVEQPRRDYTVNVMFNQSKAQIMYIPNFMEQAECDRIMEKAGKTLRQATVTGDEGNSVVSEYRRALATSVGPDFYKPGLDDGRMPQDDLIDTVFARVYDFVNTFTPYKLRREGQEDFSVIKYGKTEEYRPHCDGQCDGEEWKTGGRVATMVMYCHQPEEGGATTFTKAGVHVVPETLGATFFSYRNREKKANKGEEGEEEEGYDMMMDDGLTQHSGCPIRKGTKWVVTQWFRDGVDAVNNWNKFDPSGNPLDEFGNKI